MTNNHHTVIATGAAANASVFNSPLSQLDTSITTNATNIAATTAEVIAARAAYPNLGARLDDLILAGGNVATKANGVSNAGQKVLTVDSTTGFIVGAYVTYLLNGATLEGNTIASIQAGVSLTMGTNIGTGGVLDDSYISMISISEYQAAQAIPHAGSLTLPRAMQYASGGTVNAEAFGASPSATPAVNAAAIQAAINAAGSGTVLLPQDAIYEYDTCLDLTGIGSGLVLAGKTSYGTQLVYTGTGGNCIDLTNSAYIKIENLTVSVHAGATPAVGILMGRNETGNSAGNHKFTNIIVQGAFTKAGIYSLSSEVNQFDNVHIYVNGGLSTYCYYHSDTNDLSVASAYETLTALAGNATCTTFIGGSFANWTPVTGGNVFYFKNTVSLTMIGCSMSTDQTPALGTLTLDGVINAFINIRQEGTPSYGILAKGLVAAIVVQSSQLSGTVAGIYGANGSTLQNSTFMGLNVAGTTMQINADTMRGCVVNLNTLAGRVRTSALNNTWHQCPAEGGTHELTFDSTNQGNICHSFWSNGDSRWILNKGGLFASDLGWGIKASVASPSGVVGSIVKSVPVWTEAGAILGYVPIYDSLG